MDRSESPPDLETEQILAPEIARSIVELVADRRDLLSLSLVSRTLSHEAECELYRAPFPCSKAQSRALLELMAANPRVAAHVHTLVVDMTEDSEGSRSDTPETLGSRSSSEAPSRARSPRTPSPPTPDGRADFDQCMRALAGALKNMPQLRALRMYPDATYDATTPAWPLRQCTSRLRELRCGFAWDAELLAFLATQSGIVDLCLERTLDPSEPIPPAILPALTKFEGMPAAAARFCPGRPVTHLSIWLDGTSNLVSLVSQLAQSTRPVVSLELGDYNLVSLADLVQAGVHVHFPALRFLGPCIVAPWEEETCIPHIALFKHLHTFILLDYERQPDGPGAPAFVTRIHAACPSLRRIAFAHSVGEPWSCLWMHEAGAWTYHENAPLRFLWKGV